MNVEYAKRFVSRFKKAPKNIKISARNRIDLFVSNKFDPLLNNHALTGKYKSHRSVNVTGDWRIIFIETDKQTVYFVDIGTHSELYS